MVERASAQLCPVSPSPCKKITAAVSRSAPDTVAASVSRGTDMVLPHIHCRASCRLGLTPSGFRDRSGDSPLSPAQAHGMFNSLSSFSRLQNQQKLQLSNDEYLRIVLSS